MRLTRGSPLWSQLLLLLVAKLRTAAAAASASAFGIVPSSSPGPGGDKGAIPPPERRHDDDGGDAAGRHLRASAAGIWSLRIVERGHLVATDDNSSRPPNVGRDETERAASVVRDPRQAKATMFGVDAPAASEDPWSSSAASKWERRNERRQRKGGAEPSPVLLNLRDDGTFRQCNEGYTEGRWMKGVWSILCLCEEASTNETKTDTNKDDDVGLAIPRLYLAMDRQYYGPPVDTLFDGPYPHEALPGPGRATATTLQVTGRVREGRFALPKSDPEFFVRAMAGTLLVTGPARGGAGEGGAETVRSFTLTQVVSGRSLSEAPDASAALSEGERNAFQTRYLPPPAQPPRLDCNPRLAT